MKDGNAPARALGYSDSEAMLSIWYLVFGSKFINLIVGEDQLRWQHGQNRKNYMSHWRSDVVMCGHEKFPKTANAYEWLRRDRRDRSDGLFGKGLKTGRSEGKNRIGNGGGRGLGIRIENREDEAGREKKTTHKHVKRVRDRGLERG